jgi:hypothetical protein
MRWRFEQAAISTVSASWSRPDVGNGRCSSGQLHLHEDKPKIQAWSYVNKLLNLRFFGINYSSKFIQREFARLNTRGIMPPVMSASFPVEDALFRAALERPPRCGAQQLFEKSLPK